MRSPCPMNKPLTRLFCSYFYSCFTCTLANARLDVLFTADMKDSAFTTARIRSYTFFFLPRQYKMTSPCAVVLTQSPCSGTSRESTQSGYSTWLTCLIKLYMSVNTFQHKVRTLKLAHALFEKSTNCSPTVIWMKHLTVTQM